MYLKWLLRQFFAYMIMSGIIVLGINFIGFDAIAQTEKGTSPALSEKLSKQITLLGKEKKSRTAAQRKMSSQLVQAVKLRRGDSQMIGLSTLRSNVRIAADDTTLVDINAQVAPELLEKIKQLGGTITDSYAEYNTIRARLSVNALELLAARKDVDSIRPASRAFLKKRTTSEGDVAHSAFTTRENYSLTGQGIKVGVLSDSVDRLSYVQSLGDLPQVTVLDHPDPANCDPSCSGEGTALLEIIHDLAPDAKLYFATGWDGAASFANNIKALANAGCQVIVDDLGYFDESPFQDGIISKAVNTVTSQGVLYFSSAGNAGNYNDGTSGVWEGDFSGKMTTLDGELAEVHNFGGGDVTNRIVSDAGCYTLFWSDPLGRSNNDYDLYLLDSSNNVVGASSGYQTGTQDPFEGFCVTEDVTNYSLMIHQFSGQRRFLHLSANRGRLEHRTDGQIAGHAAAANAFAVSAVSARGRTTPFVGTEKVERFTSDGPRRVFYYPNGTPITPGNFLSTGGEVRMKPDIAAADGVRVSTPGFSPFYGTSAAAPHAAAIAALMLSGRPGLTVAEARQVFIDTAFDIEAPGWDRDSGYGLIMADKVLDRIFGAMNPGIRSLLLGH